MCILSSSSSTREISNIHEIHSIHGIFDVKSGLSISNSIPRECDTICYNSRCTEIRRNFWWYIWYSTHHTRITTLTIIVYRFDLVVVGCTIRKSCMEISSSSESSDFCISSIISLPCKSITCCSVYRIPFDIHICISRG